MFNFERSKKKKNTNLIQRTCAIAFIGVFYGGVQQFMLNVLTVLTFTVTICRFIADTKVHFVSGIEQEQEEELWDWHSVAELAKQETIATQAAGADRKSGQRSGPINTIATD